MFVLVGWGLALACIFGVYIVHGGNIGVIAHALPFEMITILGAAGGAFLANNQMKVIKASLSGLGKCFKGSKYSKARYMELMALLYDILQKARKEGLMSIEKDVEDPHASTLFQKYAVVGNDHHVVEFITDMVVIAHGGVLLEQRRAVRILDVLLDRHQAFLARLLQDVVEQGEQLHVARLAELAALEALPQALDRGLHHLGLVVGQEGAACRAEDGDHLERQGVQDHADVAAVHDVHAEDAGQCEDRKSVV